MEDAILEARKKGITVIAIGLPEGITKVFNLCIPYESLRKTVAKFISAYARISGEDV